MTYLEAKERFGSNRKMAEHFGVSTQAVYKWAKKPEKPLPKLRQSQLDG